MRRFILALGIVLGLTFSFSESRAQYLAAELLSSTALDSLVGSSEVDSVDVGIIHRNLYPDFVIIVTASLSDINNADTIQESIQQGSSNLFEAESFASIISTHLDGNVTFIDTKASSGAASTLRIKTRQIGTAAATDSVSYGRRIYGIYPKTSR